MNICILGNSYIACIKKAWESVYTKYNSHSITFFGSTADTLINTKGVDSKLIPITQQVQDSFYITSNGQRNIDFSLFDICIVHGILPTLKDWHELWIDLEDNIFYSQEFVHACMRNFNPIVTESFKPTARHLIKEIKSCTSIPVIFTIKPNPATPDHTKLISNNEYNNLCDFLTNVFNVLGINYIPQPEETIDNHFYSKQEYNKNAILLGKIPSHETKFARPGDYWHLNAAYGEIYLKQIFKYLDFLNKKAIDKLIYQ